MTPNKSIIIVRTVLVYRSMRITTSRGDCRDVRRWCRFERGGGSVRKRTNTFGVHLARRFRNVHEDLAGLRNEGKTVHTKELAKFAEAPRGYGAPFGFGGN